MYTKTRLTPQRPRLSLPSLQHSLYIPNNWKVAYLKTRSGLTPNPIFYFYSKIYYFLLPLNLNAFNVMFYSGNQSLLFRYRIKQHYTHLYFMFIEDVLYSFSRIHFMRIKFKGKGYYVYKNARNTIAPNFGYAHRLYVYGNGITIKFLTKRLVLIFGFTKNDLWDVGYRFRSTRPIKIFTGRGVRFSRQVVYRKVGKVSAYR